jgi:hypothetical protein
LFHFFNVHSPEFNTKIRLRIRKGRMMTSQRSDEIHQWRSRADEALARADQMHHPESKRMMLDIVAGYERLARRAERFLHDDRSEQPSPGVIPEQIGIAHEEACAENNTPLFDYGMPIANKPDF